MKITKIEEAKDEKKSLFDGAKKFARGFIKIAGGLVAGLYSYLLISEYGLVQTLVAALSMGITTGVIVPDLVKKLKELFDKNNKKDNVEVKENIEINDNIEAAKTM